MVTSSGSTRVLLYLLRRDLRVADNPILHHLASTPASEHGFTHLLPVYVFAAHQIEVSGFCHQGTASPYPEAKGRVTGFWRCGPHRTRFTAQSVWDVKTSLEHLGSGLVIRAGRFEHVTRDLIRGLANTQHNVGAVWITKEEPSEEEADEHALAQVCSELGVEFKAWADEKYFVDDRDLTFKNPNDLQPIFTDFRKALEPLREKPRPVLPSPKKSQLPAFPTTSAIPAQSHPFDIPDSYTELEAKLQAPLTNILKCPPDWPKDALSAHPFDGGETKGSQRLQDLVSSGAAANYKKTRNGLIGADFSTKLSAYLALGSITARQVHAALSSYENGTDPNFEHVEGYGKGENDGTYGVRFELMWRDYMRLCTRQYKDQLFRLAGFRQQDSNKYHQKWKTLDARRVPSDALDPDNNPEKTAAVFQRFLNGTTGMGLIDASQRELFLTGYTSNRARQNVASFLAKHLSIDWRYGAEWYECMLTDYDTSSNWCNWQYVAGVGNDPRGGERIFNPVKQAFDYDTDGAYVKMWVPEVRDLDNLENVFQPWTTPDEKRSEYGLAGLEMVERPVKQISFTLNRWPRGQRRPFAKRAQTGRGGGSVRGVDNNNGAHGSPRGSNRGFSTASSSVQQNSSNPRPDTNGRGQAQPQPQGQRGGFHVRGRNAQGGHIQLQSHQRSAPSSGYNYSTQTQSTGSGGFAWPARGSSGSNGYTYNNSSNWRGFRARGGRGSHHHAGQIHGQNSQVIVNGSSAE